MRAVRVAGFVVVVAMAFTACGDDDDDAAVTAPADSAVTAPADSASGDAQAYADAFSTSLQQDGDDVDITADQADCIGLGFADTIGVERLEDAGLSPADVASGEDLDFSELELSEGDGDELYDAFGNCDVDLRDTMVNAMLGSEGTNEEFRTCIDDGLTDDVVREFVVAALVHGDDAGASDGPAAFDAVLTSCLGSATGSVPTTSTG